MIDRLQGRSPESFNASAEAFFWCVLGMIACIDIGILREIIRGLA